MNATAPRLLLVLSFLLGAPVAVASPTPVPAQNGRVAEAARLYEQALDGLRHDDFDRRRRALQELEQAVLLDPGNPEYELALARSLYQAGQLKRARTHFERVTHLAPEDADARFGLGQVWRRDWLKYLDGASLGRAVENFSAAARLRPRSCDAWLMLTPLLFEQGQLRSAAAAARHALEADPGRPEALLAVAYTAYREGQVARAESAFVASISRLKRSVRQRFEDISPVAGEEDTVRLHRLPPEEQGEFVRRFWKENDPDLSTPESEAQLEYWARVTQAYFLFYDPKRREWDERGEIYARYGPPERAAYNPLGASLQVRTSGAGFFPANLLVWDYPSLGMQVELQDRLLRDFYMLPLETAFDPDPTPDPDSLARRGTLATAGGRGVFPTLPPGVREVPLEGAVARFETETGARLLATLETPGGPGDGLWAEWAVLDSARTEIARGRRELAPSACDAAGLRVADFAADLPAGDYLVGLAVRDGAGRRGTLRGPVRVEPPRRAVQLSDVVVSCGAPDVGGTGGEPQRVRIDPNPAGHVAAGQVLTVYFEVYHLQAGRDGLAHFEYTYRVQSLAKDGRIWIVQMLAPRPQPPAIEARREEQQLGPLRRQFVTVPVQSLPAGRYRLEVKVRDLVADEEVASSAEFVRSGPAAPGDRQAEGKR